MRRGPARRWRAFSTGSACRAQAYDAITSSGDVTRGVVAARLDQSRVSSRPAARPVDFRRPRREVRAAGARRLRGVLRPVRRHDRNAGELSRHARGDARALAVHGLRQSRHRRRARRHAGLLRRRACRRLRGAGRRGALLRQAARADLRRGAGRGRRLSRRHDAGAQSRARHRRFGAHRSCGRRRFRARLYVRHLGHPRRAIRLARGARHGRA